MTQKTVFIFFIAGVFICNAISFISDEECDRII